MKPLKFVSALLALTGLVAAAHPAPHVDWTRHVTETPAGAFVVGNPKAPVKLVEYLSYTCPHCGHFTGEAAGPLMRDYVAKGTTSVEFRHAVRDPLDMAATLVVRCTGPARFFKASEAVFAAQPQWVLKGEAYIQANSATLQKMAPAQSLLRLVHASGLDAMAKGFGLTDKQVATCVTSKAAQKPVLAMTDEAWSKRKIPGTPYFLVNGAGQDGVTSWAALQPKLKP